MVGREKITNEDSERSAMKQKKIKMNGRVLNAALIIDDPDCKRTVYGRDGKKCHVCCISSPVYLKGYLKRHPEGIIIDGYGIAFFKEPVLISPSMVSFDQSGNANICFRDNADKIERQLEIMDQLSEIAGCSFRGTQGDQVS